MDRSLIIGSALTLIAANIMLLLVIIYTIQQVTLGFGSGTFKEENIVLYLGLSILAVIGGGLGVAGRKSGGVLVLISGFMTTLFGILSILDPTVYAEYERPIFTSFTLLGGLAIPIPLEALLILIGGIFILKAKSD